MAPNDVWSRLWNAATRNVPASFMPSELPSWTRRPLPSDWIITRSNSRELDFTAFAMGKGTLQIAHRSTPQNEHTLWYKGVGLTTSKGPVPLEEGGSYSDYDMPGGNGWVEVPPAFDFIGVGPGSGNIQLSDFEGPGFVMTGALGRPGVVNYDPQQKRVDSIGFAGTGVTMFVFGWTPPIAVGYTIGMQHMVPGIGITIMPCYFWVMDSEWQSAHP